MVHAEAPDAVTGSRSGADFAVVDSGGGASRAVLINDREIPGTAGAAGLGSGVGGAGAAVRGRGVAGLFAGARESAERGQHGLTAAGADDDDGGLGGYFLKAFLTSSKPRSSAPSVELALRPRLCKLASNFCAPYALS